LAYPQLAAILQVSPRRLRVTEPEPKAIFSRLENTLGESLDRLVRRAATLAIAKEKIDLAPANSRGRTT
jgi:hypothetical protein